MLVSTLNQCGIHMRTSVQLGIPYLLRINLC